MAAAWYSRLGGDVNLPLDLLPDDTIIIHDPTSGKALLEIDLDDPHNEIAADLKQEQQCVTHALAHYNTKNGTDYKEVDFPGYGRFIFHSKSSENLKIIHFGFTAAPSTAIDHKSFFMAEFRSCHEYGGEVLSFCRMVNEHETTGCKDCDVTIREMHEEQNVKAHHTKSAPIEDKHDQILSQYLHLLADGVTLSEKAMWRLQFPILALEYYNKKHCKSYKLVDALPLSGSTRPFMKHCNFIARQSGSADDESDKLFFAELHRKGGDCWVVTACRLLHGCKTTAGCHACRPPRNGKRVVHPTTGFRFGLYP